MGRYLRADCWSLCGSANYSAMLDESDAGAAYLAALRQSRAPQAPASATDASEPRSDTRLDSPKFHDARFPNPIPSATTPASPEKRKSPRYKCNGSARLQDGGSAASTWATFSDISMHGCYVESAAPYSSGTLLDLRLDANGFHIEATGEVRVTYPGLGMGISFTKISEVNRERLRELIRSISRPSVILSSQATERSQSIPGSDIPHITNPTTVLQAIMKFFEDRHMMGREEFLRILRKSL